MDVVIISSYLFIHPIRNSEVNMNFTNKIKRITLSFMIYGNIIRMSV